MEEEEYENAALLRRSFAASYGSVALPEGDEESPSSSGSNSAPSSIFGRLKRSFRRKNQRDYEASI